MGLGSTLRECLMKGVFIADLKMIPCSARIDAQRLMSRQADLLRDLHCLVPRLANLCFGTLDVSWVVNQDACWLRLQLVPRQRLLFDPLGASHSRPGSLPEEARLVWTDICDSQLRALQADSGLVTWSNSETRTPPDPLHEMEFRRSRAQWIFEAESGQQRVQFPQAPRYLVDEEPCKIHGVVDAVLRSALVLRQARIEPTHGPTVALQGQLRIAPDNSDTPRRREARWQLTLGALPGSSLSLPVVLHRCLLSRRVVGAVVKGTIED